MINEQQLEALSVLKLWAKLQEVTIHRRESQAWADFYKERLLSE